MGEILNDRKAASIISHLGSDYKVQYSYRENGALIFVNDSVSNIKLKIDLMALYSSFHFPILTGESVEECVDIFDKECPMLVVLTNLEKSWESKELFLNLYKKDPFLKYINYNESPSQNRAVETKKIRNLYDDTYENILVNYLEQKSKNKPNLENKLRNPIMDKIEFIRIKKYLISINFSVFII